MSTLPILILLAFGLVGTVASPPPVAIRVRPTIMLQRGDIRIEVRVPRNAANRLLAIAWDSEGGSTGSTQRALDGDNAEVLHTLDLRSQPPAHYLFVATVIDRLGKVAGTAKAEIYVPEQENPR